MDHSICFELLRVRPLFNGARTALGQPAREIGHDSSDVGRVDPARG